ncbi:SPOSA6832_00967 [Sporobolomyces salmonicolor]|uniref:SPOSA6832_00967-mRNA-1:cds n=1 Tax=Sporidiobolus salmonicolor TaxID=5005 RepID=A0A0D6EI34_SPOSA|nr:SPOSA6832_00967 [Sporobolomyces salmonicolor]
MSDAFFSKPRPFSKRKREGAAPSSAKPGRHGTSARGGALSRGGGRGGAKRGRGGRSGGDGKGKRRAEEDEELDLPDDGAFDSDELGSDVDGAEAQESSEEEDELETPAQKRLRLSQMYLKSLEKDKEEEVGFDAADLDRDIIAERLQQDVLEHTGKLHLNVASTLQLPIPSSSIFHTPAKGHRGAVTSAVASHDGEWLYTASKDGSIIKYDLSAVTSASSSSSASPSTPAEAPRITRVAHFAKALSASQKRNGDKAATKKGDKGKGKETTAAPAEGHTDEILDLAISHDGKILASGGRDKVIGCWDISGEGGKWLRGLGGHKDKVASIAFRLGTQQLYSSSFDRTVKLFDLSTLSYIETLFGHQDCIQSIDALRGELAVTAGGRDKTVRYWKVMEESQLVFRGGGASRMRNVLEGAMEDEGIEEEERRRRRKKAEEKGPVKFAEGSIDCVAMVDDTTLLSGGDSGSICLWTITKKKPIHTVQLAHGINEHTSETEGVIGTPRWITALSCLPYGDTFASGSWDGSIRLWKIDERVRSFALLTTIRAVGYINSLQLTSPALRPTKEAHIALKGKKQERDEKQKSLVVVAGVSKEPRLGRWMRMKEGREGAVVAVIPMA